MRKDRHGWATTLSVAAALALGSWSITSGTGAFTPQERADVLMPFAEFQPLYDKGGVLVMDVRDRESFAFGRIPGAINIPLGEAKAREAEIRKAAAGRPIVTYCSCPSEATSARAARSLEEMGFKAKALVGGYVKWVESGGRVEKGRP